MSQVIQFVIIFKIRMVIREKNINLKLVKVKSHSGIPGNEKADEVTEVGLS